MAHLISFYHGAMSPSQSQTIGEMAEMTPKQIDQAAERRTLAQIAKSSGDEISEAKQAATTVEFTRTTGMNR